ncbi:MAG: beta-ketoacyl synthase N-terminal-like domain-containing protein [Anaerolineaceae bacterium]|nr:beta-ketoacyl synthase N-terminal-like domain-containing protein [Anaerolineaceae bacterium]
MRGPQRSEAVIVGVGAIPVGYHFELSLRNMAVQAILQARAEAPELEPQAVFVGNMLASGISHQANLGALICEYANLKGCEGVTVEAAEAGGAAALYQAVMAIRSGYIDTALVLGIEKVSDNIDAELEMMLARTLDADYESETSMTLNAQAALLMQRYLYENNVPREALAGFPLLAHKNAVGNPLAMYRKKVSEESYAKSALVAEPLNLFDVAPYADGAAALLISRADLLSERIKQGAIRISGSSLISGRLALHDRKDPLFFEPAAVSVQKACEKARVSVADLDFFEFQDATTLHALLSLEAAGFAHRGEAWKLARDGELEKNGALPCQTMGGCKARGFPLAANGVYQAYEAALQLRGQAKECQVSGARIGMIQALGGNSATAVTTVLERLT